MIEGYVKHSYQKNFVIPVAKKLTFLHPNHITFLALLVGVSAALFAINGFFSLAVFSLFLSGYLDSLDGVLARLTNQSSPLGSALDIVCDRIVEFFIIFSFFLINPSQNGLYAFLILGCSFICVTSFLVTGIFTYNNSEKSFYYSPGLIERFEAFLFFALMYIFSKYFNVLAILYTLLVCWTALSRLNTLRQTLPKE